MIKENHYARLLKRCTVNTKINIKYKNINKFKVF